MLNRLLTVLGVAGWMLVSACPSPPRQAQADTAPISSASAGRQSLEVARCPIAGNPRRVGRISFLELTEASGLVQGISNPFLFYTHNDSGGSADLYAMNEAGDLVAILNYAGARARDWEDVAIGPGPDPASHYLYVGDIGDNARARSEIRVLRSLEPAIDPAARRQVLQVTYDRIRLRYPDGPHNAETLLIDPLVGHLYLLTKENSGSSALYVARAPLATDSVITLEKTTTVTFGKEPLVGSRLATGGDVAPDGRAVLVRTYTGAFLWRKATASSLEEVFTAAPCSMPTPYEKQGEAVAFSRDGKGFYTLSEGRAPILYRVDLGRGP